MTLALRPTFSLDLDRPSREVLSQAFDRLARAAVQLRKTQIPGGGRTTTPAHDHFILTVPEAQQHFWSPWLSVDVSPQGSGSHVFARFMPHPSVWTAFMFGYLALSIAVLFSLVFALALSNSGGSPWTLAITGGAVVIMVLMWWASQVGQRLARAQMEELRQILETALSGEPAEPGEPAERRAE